VAGRGTTATVALERAGIPFTVHEYSHDPRHESYGREASEALGVSAGRVFKTLIASVDGSWPPPTWSGPRTRPWLASGLCARDPEEA
jgi:hypothetical protein